MRKLHIAPVGDQRWLLTLDDDAEPPISEHGSRGEAETAARAYAETFGFPQIDVHGADGDVDVMLLEVAPQPPYPGAAKGPPGAG